MWLTKNSKTLTFIVANLKFMLLYNSSQIMSLFTLARNVKSMYNWINAYITLFTPARNVKLIFTSIYTTIFTLKRNVNKKPSCMIKYTSNCLIKIRNYFKDHTNERVENLMLMGQKALPHWSETNFKVEMLCVLSCNYVVCPHGHGWYFFLVLWVVATRFIINHTSSIINEQTIIQRLHSVIPRLM